MKEITSYTTNRPVIYFGARHWNYLSDKKISEAAIRGGAVGTSTDIGSSNLNKKGVGTIPHALEVIFGWVYGQENAVLEATKSFDKWISKKIERVALVDYNNKEIDDTIKIVNQLKNVTWIRLDTCGENIIQNSLSFDNLKDHNGIYYPEEKINQIIKEYFDVDIKYSTIPKEDLCFWFGNGVTISGVYLLKKTLISNNKPNIKIMLTSGFGNIMKVKAFSKAEKILKIKLYDSLGIGGLYPSRDATMDIVAVGKDNKTMTFISKKGRTYRPNSRLRKIF